MRGFGGYHPTVLFIYYILLISITMLSMHPVLMAASLAGAFFLYGGLFGMRKFFGELGFCFCLFFILAVTNPLFVHNGETILFFMNDNPMTLEAMVYGGVAALMVLSILLWCRCYSMLLTTDKFLYLFGKLIPKLGLLLSMSFRFIPLFKHQMQKIGQSQKSMGLYATDSITDRVAGGVRVFDSLVAWSMENSIDTADAMKARGYGLPGRTNFSLFRFHRQDGILLGIMGLLFGTILWGYGTGVFSFYYYPYIATVSWTWQSVLQYMLVLVFACIPGILEIKEKVSWNYLKSKI